MKITNNLGLPDMLVRATEKEYQYRDKRYSITSLLDPSRVIMLKRKFNNEITQDISECIWMLFGSFTHFALENIELKPNEYVEYHTEHTFDSGYTLSGIADHIDVDNGYMDDYKTTSVYTVLYGSNMEHWKLQLQMGAYLFYKEKGIWLKKGRIIAILKDFNKRDSENNKDYPKLPVAVIDFDLGTPNEVESWIINKFKEISELEKLDVNELPMCTMSERFNNGDKYAIMKKGNKRALKVHDNIMSANEHLNNLNKLYPNTYEIEERRGIDTKCLNYCSCNEFCPYYLENYSKEIKEIVNDLEKENR